MAFTLEAIDVQDRVGRAVYALDLSLHISGNEVTNSEVQYLIGHCSGVPKDLLDIRTEQKQTNHLCQTDTHLTSDIRNPVSLSLSIVCSGRLCSI